MKVFSNIPFLRIILVWITGILVGLQLAPLPPPVTLTSLMLLVITAFSVIRRISVRGRIFWLLGCDITLVLLAICQVSAANRLDSAFHYSRELEAGRSDLFIASVEDLPVKKGARIRCFVELDALRRDSSWKSVEGTLLLYLPDDSAVSTLSAGDAIVFRAVAEQIAAPLNPHEFSYKEYLADRQIYHSAFVSPGEFYVADGQGTLSPAWRLGLSCREWLVNCLRTSGLDGDSYAISAALLTGFDDDIDRDVMNAFSHSGTLHVLSVSGLHVGMIYLVLNFLLGRLDRYNRHRLVRLIIVLLTLWFFALMTGFSGPVLRAVIMFSFQSAGRLYFRATASNQLNILFFSAFLLLGWNPYYLKDVGFQLSYLAMTGLFILQPVISGFWQPRYTALKYFWESAAASIAATISTLPVTLYVFHQFPTWFVFSNIVVVPASFLIMLLALLIVLHCAFLVKPVNFLIGLLKIFISWFDVPGVGYADRINFDVIDALMLSVVIFAFYLAIVLHSGRALFSGAIFLIIWQVAALLSVSALLRQEALYVYHIRKGSAIAIRQGVQTFFDTSDTAKAKRATDVHLTLLGARTCTGTRVRSIRGGSAFFHVLRPECGDLQNGITHLLVTDNAIPEDEILRNLTSLRLIIADGSNSKRTIRRLEGICRKFAVGFHNTATSGAFELSLE